MGNGYLQHPEMGFCPDGTSVYRAMIIFYKCMYLRYKDLIIVIPFFGRFFLYRFNGDQAFMTVYRMNTIGKP